MNTSDLTLRIITHLNDSHQKEKCSFFRNGEKEYTAMYGYVLHYPRDTLSIERRETMLKRFGVVTRLME